MVQVYYGNGQPWDDHGNIEKGHRDKGQKSDQAIAGLLRDLKLRGLLDDTLVLWGGGVWPHSGFRRRERTRPQ